MRWAAKPAKTDPYPGLVQTRKRYAYTPTKVWDNETAEDIWLWLEHYEETREWVEVHHWDGVDRYWSVTNRCVD